MAIAIAGKRTYCELKGGEAADNHWRGNPKSLVAGMITIEVDRTWLTAPAGEKLIIRSILASFHQYQVSLVALAPLVLWQV